MSISSNKIIIVYYMAMVKDCFPLPPPITYINLHSRVWEVNLACLLQHIFMFKQIIINSTSIKCNINRT